MQRESFKSSFGFLMAAIGFAVGLGNIWRFPYMTGENGGGAFLVVYLVCAAFIALPILIAELVLGQKGGDEPLQSMRHLASSIKLSPRWQWMGLWMLATAFLIMVTYATVAGWVLIYGREALTGAFVGLDGTRSADAFEVLKANRGIQTVGVGCVLLVALVIIYGGVRGGIERAVTIMMPLLLLLLFGLAVYNAHFPGFEAALDYLLRPDFSRIDASVGLAAVGQAFFSIGVAMAGMWTYGAYLPANQSIFRISVLVVIADTAVALLAGLVIFPLVFRYGLDPAGGVGLIFQVLPVAFGQMSGGVWLATAFFVLLALAAISSIVGFIEPLVVARARFIGGARRTAALQWTLLLFVFSILNIYAFGDVAVVGAALNDQLDFLSNQIMLPLGGVMVAAFVGWRLAPHLTPSSIGLKQGNLYQIWLLLLRVVLPVALIILLMTGTGLISF